ncbi:MULTISPECIES: hypothetical protein [unclassified Ochrobactrum]|uniref:hypothetical protein n=1 Tax=unclassified Ochrobactrum TaxID=239106 RepID=UPI0030B39557
MSSTYLDATDNGLISKILRKARLPNDTQDLRTAATRYFARQLLEGTYHEDRLRIALDQFIKNHKAMDQAVDR